MRMELKAVKTSNWLSAIRGLRNPLQSWDKMDSHVKYEPYDFFGQEDFRDKPILGTNDYKLATGLAEAGGCHPKFLRQIQISCNIVAPLLWWVEYDTYKVGTVANSTSKMFKLGHRELTKDDLDLDTWDKDDEVMLAHVNKTIKAFMKTKEEFGAKDDRTKKVWRKLQQIVPSSFVYERTVTLNYEVLRSMAKFRAVHKLVEWRKFIDLMVKEIPYGQDFILDYNKGTVKEISFENLGYDED